MVLVFSLSVRPVYAITWNEVWETNWVQLTIFASIGNIIYFYRKILLADDTPPIRLPTLRQAGGLCLGVLYTIIGGVGLKEITKDLALPESLQSKKESHVSSKILHLSQELEACKLKNASIDTIAQLNRIDELKTKLTLFLTKNYLNTIEDFLKDCSLFGCTDHSRDISNALIEWGLEMLELYPGYIDSNSSFLAVSDKQAQKTGEHYTYNETVISEETQKYYLNRRFSLQTIQFLNDHIHDLKDKKKERIAGYLLHFFRTIGLKMEPIEILPTSNARPATSGDL